jgi:DNA-binding LytR/AlgR family response regulator
MKCLLFEDNQQTRILLESFISNTKGIQLINSYTDVLKHLPEIKKHPQALLIMDIELKKENALDILAKLKLNNPILFVTGHKKYAFDALQQNIYGYLLKPIKQDEFITTINTIKNRIEGENYAQKENNSIVVKSKFQSIKINIDDILFIKSDKDYLVFHLENEQVKSPMTFADLELEKFPNTLIRTHKSFVINTHKVRVLYKNSILIMNHEIPIGRTYKKHVINQIIN